MQKQGFVIAGLFSVLACNPGGPASLVGPCGPGCPSGQICSDAGCVSPCIAAGGTDCGSNCVDPQTDHANCGSCGNACPSGLVCSGGACATSCGAAYLACGFDGGAPYCASGLTDSANCGGCGQVCASTASCVDGGCVTPTVSCPEWQTLCTNADGSQVCSRLRDDNANCGSCGHACGANTTCVGTECTLQCSGDLIACADNPSGVPTCVDAQNDPHNCGGCGFPCTGPNEFCARGACECSAGATLCQSPYNQFSSCVLLQTDLLNCGACGQRCVPCETCSGGICIARDDILTPVPVLGDSNGPSTLGVAAGDFNADGLPDVSVIIQLDISSGATELQILFGDGGGGFSTSATIAQPLDTSFMDLAVGDFNGDGLTDLVAATIGNDGGGFPQGSGFTVFFGEADGGLLASPVTASSAAESTAVRVLVADLNGDGHDDVALLNYGRGIDVFYGLGDGGFTAASTLSVRAEDFAIADVNGDGRPDLVVAGFASVDDQVSVFLQEAGSLQLAAAVPAADAFTVAASTGEIDVFSGTDLSVFSFGDAGLVSIGDVSNPLAPGFPWTGVAVDLNGDGLSDLLTSSCGTQFVLLGHDVGGPYGAANAQTGGFNCAFRFAVADFNGDGRPDVALSGGIGASVLLNTCAP